LPRRFDTRQARKTQNPFRQLSFTSTLKTFQLRFVQSGFYNQVGGQWVSSDASFERCRSCQGSGVIWHKREPKDDNKKEKAGERELLVAFSFWVDSSATKDMTIEQVIDAFLKEMGGE
jgi:hypothetical protein